MARHKRAPKNPDFSPAALLKAPVAAAWLGAVSNAWALIEVEASKFMEYMITEPYIRKVDAPDPLGLALFKAIPTWKQRWGIIQTIYRTRLNAKERKRFSNRLELVSEALRNAADKAQRDSARDMGI